MGALIEGRNDVQILGSNETGRLRRGRSKGIRAVTFVTNVALVGKNWDQVCTVRVRHAVCIKQERGNIL